MRSEKQKAKMMTELARLTRQTGLHWPSGSQIRLLVNHHRDHGEFMNQGPKYPGLHPDLASRRPRPHRWPTDSSRAPTSRRTVFGIADLDFFAMGSTSGVTESWIACFWRRSPRDKLLGVSSILDALQPINWLRYQGQPN